MLEEEKYKLRLIELIILICSNQLNYVPFCKVVTLGLSEIMIATVAWNKTARQTNVFRCIAILFKNLQKTKKKP